jgi:hypothetical protein
LSAYFTVIFGDSANFATLNASTTNSSISIRTDNS